MTDLLQLIQMHNIDLNQVPVYNYILFYQRVVNLLEEPGTRIECYTGFREEGHIRLFCVIACDGGKSVKVFSYTLRDEPGMLVAPITAHHLGALEFELDLADEFGIAFGQLKGRRHLAKLQHSVARLLSNELKHIHKN